MAARVVGSRGHCSRMIGFEHQNRTVLLCRDYVADELSDKEICQTFHSIQISIVSDLQNLSSHSGQCAVVTLVSLLSRMGMQIGLSIPEIPMLHAQPPTSGRSITEALAGLSNRLIPGASIRIDPEIKPDIVFALGNTRIANDKVPSWRLSGDEWRGVVTSRIGHGQVPDRWAADWPIGGMVSAALAANEAFKFVMRRMALRNEKSRPFLESSQSCSWSFDSIPLPESELDLGQVDLVSAGAIIQASLYALVRLPRVQMSGRIFDDDLTAPSNLNRNMLTVADDVGRPKVLVAAQRCCSKLRLDSITSRFEGGKFASPNLAQQVLVGVDDIPSRWEIQRHTPNWAAVSGTSHFNISSSAHSVDEPCSGCLHPVDDLEGLNPIPTVSFISFWAGLVMAVRLIREALRRPYPRNRQHLWLSPLRMDSPRAAMWSPVPPVRNCPVRCAASQAFA
jgi:hypothetical protein